MKLLGAAMGGKASWEKTPADGTEDSKTDIRCMTNKQALAAWQIAPLEVELRVRRLKQYQTWAGQPDHHTQVLAAIFGTAKLDEKHEKARMLDGKLTESSTPWASSYSATRRPF